MLITSRLILSSPSRFLSKTNPFFRFQSTIARETCPECQLLFPWRERPPVHNSPANVVKLLYSRSVLSVVEKEDDFLTGASAAFQCAIESIFRHPILRNHIILTEDQSSTKIVEEAPVIDVVLEDRLASFYEDAIRNFVQNPRYRISQQLVSINKYNIVSGEILLYSEALNNHEFLVRHPQKVLGIDVLRPQHPSSEGESEIDRLLLRLWIDFECSGNVFLIETNYNYLNKQLLYYQNYSWSKIWRKMK